MVVHSAGQVKRFCGIDPALVNIGFCGLEDSILEPELIHCPLFGAARLAFIYSEINTRVLRRKPALVAIEGYSLDSISRQHAFGEGGGVIKLALCLAGIPFIIVAPKQLKRFVTGSGDARKKRMIRAVNKKYGLEIENDNLADAIGLAKVAELYAGATVSQIRAELEIVAKLGIENGNS